MENKPCPRPRQAPASDGELPLPAALLTIFLCVLFGANVVAIKFSLMGMGPLTTAAVRFSLASLVLLLWARRRHIPLRVHGPLLRRMLVIAMIFCVQMAGMYYGQTMTTASHGTLLANVLPFVVMILAHFFLEDDAVTGRKMIGLTMGFSGIILLFFDSLPAAEQSLRGDIIIFCAVLLWACNVILIKRIILEVHPVLITVLPMLVSAPLLWAAALLSGEEMVFAMTPAVVLSLLYQILVTASFGFIMWNTLIRRYGVTSLHSFVFIMPIAGVSFGILLLGEPLTGSLIGSILLVSAGLLVVNSRGKKRGQAAGGERGAQHR